MIKRILYYETELTVSEVARKILNMDAKQQALLVDMLQMMANFKPSHFYLQFDAMSNELSEKGKGFVSELLNYIEDESV